MKIPEHRGEGKETPSKTKNKKSHCFTWIVSTTLTIHMYIQVCYIPEIYDILFVSNTSLSWTQIYMVMWMELVKNSEWWCTPPARQNTVYCYNWYCIFKSQIYNHFCDLKNLEKLPQFNHSPSQKTMVNNLIYHVYNFLLCIYSYMIT